jgi:hypothetical protein
MRSLLILLPVFLSGCVAFPVQPATPAKYLDVRSLDQAPSCDRYYLLVFSSENALRQPRYTHTWATAVRVADKGAGKQPFIEHHTISWMPTTLDIDPLRLQAEPGVNLGLHDSITKVALANDERIALWGPYECRPSLYTRFVVQKQFMESGQMGYQCIDNVGEAARTGKACNCIHAITDMDSVHGRRQYPLTRYGFDAGLEITRRFREMDVLIDPTRRHDFLLPVLALQNDPILRGNADDVLKSSRSPIIGIR